MDRRTFLAGAGTAGLIGTTVTAVRESNAAKARARGLAQAAGPGTRDAAVSAAPTQASKALVAHGVTLGYLPGSAGLFAMPAGERLMRLNPIGLRWAKWDASLVSQTSQFAVHSLFKASTLVDLSIGILRRVDAAAAGALRGLDITAHFAIADAPYFAPFNAWRYEAGGLPARAKSTQPLTFSARVPNFLALEVNYAIDASAVATGINSAGSLYLPIGPSAESGAGLATGLYVFAAPSAHTGLQPDLSAYVFTGDVHAPIADTSGRAPDFDYVTLAIRAVAV